MIRIIQKEGGGILVELNRMEALRGTEEVNPGDKVPKILEPVLTRYQGIFEMPPRLPPL